MSEKMNKLGMFTICITLLFLLVIFYWSFYPYNIIEHTHTPMHMITGNVIAGEYAEYEAQGCKYEPLIADVSVLLLDGYQINYATKSSNSDVGCFDINKKLLIPEYVPTGVYHFKVTYIYHPNPIRDIIVVTETEHFNVTNIESIDELKKEDR